MGTKGENPSVVVSGDVEDLELDVRRNIIFWIDNKASKVCLAYYYRITN